MKILTGLLNSILLLLGDKTPINAPDDASYQSPSPSPPGLPSKDPFYGIPEVAQLLPPGSILGFRKPPFPLGAMGVGAFLVKEAHQLAYRTTDSNGNFTTSVTTVLVPENADYSRVFTLLIAEDANTIDCAPSYGFQMVPDISNALRSNTTQGQLVLAEAALAKGWVVNMPDFEGAKGSYSCTKSQAYAALDSMRATVLSGEITGVRLDANISMLGYSGGASVVTGALGFQEDYAPELSIVGAVAGGLSASNVDLFTLSGTLSAGLIPLIMVGLATMHPDLAAIMKESLEPDALALFDSTTSQCLEANLINFVNKDIVSMFRSDLFQKVNETLHAAAAAEETGAKTPSVPMYVYQASHDQLTPIADVDAVIEGYCRDGATVHYLKDVAPSMNHQTLAYVGILGALDWMEGIFNGTIVETGCVNETTSLAAFPQGFFDLFPADMQSFLHKWFG